MYTNDGILVYDGTRILLNRFAIPKILNYLAYYNAAGIDTGSLEQSYRNLIKHPSSEKSELLITPCINLRGLDEKERKQLVKDACTVHVLCYQLEHPESIREENPESWKLPKAQDDGFGD